MMPKKKRAADRKLIRVDQEILKLAAAELVKRVTREITQSLAAGTVKLGGFGSRDAARRPASRAQAARRRRPRGRGQHG
jgi:nucleoid DNA-binding protein